MAKTKDVPNHPGYTVTDTGVVYKPDGSELSQFNSSGYKQVRMIDSNGERSIKGVHQVVAMSFDESYYPGCVVHHIDGNKHNNRIKNLKVESRSDHSRRHANPEALIKHMKEFGPYNKGMKMDSAFCEKCRQSALNRKNKNTETIFHGNQFCDSNGNAKEVSDEYRKRFSESCKRGALNRKK